MNYTAAFKLVEELGARRGPTLKYALYRDDPCGFAKDVLGVEWTPVQQEIAKSLLVPPCRTLVKASHNVGKTHLAAGIAAWWFLTRQPAIVITTAPKLEQVRDLLWKEIRRQAGKHLKFAGPRICRVDRAADDFMAGTTAQSGTGFQGHHGPHLLFLFDEAVGVAPEFWEVTETMFAPPGHAWLCIFNPTDSTSAAYQAEMATGADGRATWHVITMSSLDHPNIVAELEGKPPPIPSAIRLGRLRDMLAEWCDPVTGDPDPAADVEFDGEWLHPGPLAEARLLGRWPSAAAGVWSDALWRRAARQAGPGQLNPWSPLAIGCDVARFGDDCTAMHVRCGAVSLHHEWHNGWDGAQIVGRLKELCREWSAWVNRQRNAPSAAPLEPRHVLVNVDQDGMGGMGVVDHAGGWNFRGVSAASVECGGEYPNLRSQLWFHAAGLAKKGELFLGGLPKAALDRLRQQLLAPVYKLDSQGRRVVEPKDETKEKLGRSPDDADALHLAYYAAPSRVAQAQEPDWQPDRQGARHFRDRGR